MYYRTLDGLRGIGVLAVVLYHADILAMGWMGVQLFFVLSGFLITSILLQAKEQPALAYFGGFYWRRMLRIFPLYFGFLALAGLAYLLTGHPAGTAAHMPYLATYTFNFDRALIQDPQDLFFRHLWSLSFEEQFYLVWPLLIWLLPLKGMRLLVLLLIFTAPLFRMAIGMLGTSGELAYAGPLTYCMPLGHLDAFALGAAVVIFPAGHVKPSAGEWLGVAFALFLMSGLANWWAGATETGRYLIPAFGYPIGSLAQFLHVWGYSLENFLFATMVLFAVRGTAGHWLSRAFSAGWLVALGKISYGVYVIHWPVLLAWKHLVPASAGWGMRLVWLVPVLALVWGLAWLSWRYFERWFLRFRG